MRIRMGYPDKEAEREIFKSDLHWNGLESLKPAATSQQIHELQKDVLTVSVESSLVDYMLTIVAKTRSHDNLSLGVSPRGSQALHRAAQALVFLDSRNYCIVDDFKRLVLPVFAHRIVVN